MKNKLLFLDEPTSVLTPQEADEVLTMLRNLVNAGELTVLMITHKFKEVMKFCDDVTVLRTGRLAGQGSVKELSPADMSTMMIGSETTRTADRVSRERGEALLEIEHLEALDDLGLTCLHDLNLKVHAGEVVGIAGVSGNGQSKLVEVSGRPAKGLGRAGLASSRGVHGSRAEIRKHKVNLLPEEPLRNACVGPMSVAGNIAMRTFDIYPNRLAGFFLNRSSIRKRAKELIAKVSRQNARARMSRSATCQAATCSARCWRENSPAGVEVLITANPCFGLDFAAASEIRAQIMEARNRGVAVSAHQRRPGRSVRAFGSNRIVMFHGSFVYETTSDKADIGIIGRHMAGHGEDHAPKVPEPPVA